MAKLRTAVVIFIIGISTVIGVSVRLQSHHTTPPSALFYTDVYPRTVEWIDDGQLLLVEDHAVRSYDLDSRTTASIYEPTGSTVLAAHFQSGTYLVVTTIIDDTAASDTDTGELVAIDRTGRTISRTPLPPVSYALFGDDRLCLTTIHIISSPEQTATRISLYNTRSETFSADTPLAVLTSPLTLVPTLCDDTLTLEAPFPLRPDIYSWSRHDQKPKLISQSKENEVQQDVPNMPDMPDSPVNFIFSMPSKDGQSFALISETGELWILQVQEEPRLNFAQRSLEFLHRVLERFVP